MLAAGLLAAGPAQAAFQSCVGTGYDISDKVQYTGGTPADDCTILTPLNANQNDSPSPDFVNGQAFFGHNDWAFAGRQNMTGATPGSYQFGTVNIYFSATDALLSGNWSFDTTGIDDVEEVMLIFKDGGDTNLVGYLLTTVGNQTGTWTSPFVEPPFTFPGTGPREVSHISAYVRLGDTTIPNEETPEPAALALFGTGLVGLFAARRRRRARATG